MNDGGAAGGEHEDDREPGSPRPGRDDPPGAHQNASPMPNAKASGTP